MTVRALPLLILLAATAPSRARQDDAPPWRAMDYGPFLSAAIEIDGPDDIAFKGIAVPLGGPGGASMLFDTDLLRWACGWPGAFVELRGIVYDGPHGTFPRIAGAPDWRNPPAPGVSPDGDFDDPRGMRYGPLPAGRAAFSGVLVHGRDVALAYRVGSTELLDAPSVIEGEGVRAYVRTIEHGAVERLVMLQLVRAPLTARRTSRRAGPARTLVLERRGVPFLGIGVVAGRADGVDLRTAGDGDVRLSLGPADPGRVEVLIAPLLGPDQVAPFERLVASRPAPASLDRFRAGGPSLWSSRPVLAGLRGVRFDEPGIVRGLGRTPGDPAERVEIDPGGAALARLVGLDGAELEATTAEVAGAALVVERAGTSPPLPRAAWDFDEGAGARMRDRVSGRRNLRLDGVTWRRGVRGRALDFDGTGRAQWEDGDLDPLQADFSFAAWIHTTKDGTIVSRTTDATRWVPHGWTFFVRGGKLGFDVGWVGVVAGATPVADGAWHHVAFTWRRADGHVTLYLDGALEAQGDLPPEAPIDDPVVRLGFTADNFPAEPWFSGYLDGARVYDRVLEPDEIRGVAAESGEPLTEAWGVRGTVPGARWRRGAAPGSPAAIEMPAATEAGSAALVRWSGRRSQLGTFLATLGRRGLAARPFAIDALTWPDDNAYASWMRFGAFDFLPGGTSAAITTWSGDVWRVDGLDDDLDALRWQRIATGLHQPLGLAVRDGEILVLARDQITRLDDLNGDGETDRYACFFAGAMNSEHFHEPCTGLQVAPNGDLLYLKAARHAKDALHPQHGSVVRVAADGSSSEVVARGFRAPNGLWLDADGTMFGSDQEGHWMPANRINAIRPGGFYGNNWAWADDRPRATYDPPLCWVHPRVDRSPSAQVRVDSPAWGDLDGALLGLSYGTGEVYRILEDEVDGVRQGGIVPLPIGLPTGLMMGRFNPADGHLYLCGLFGWSSNKTDPGGFYRVRAVGPAPLMVEHVRAVRDGLVVRFNRSLDADSLRGDDAFTLQAWNYDWSERYGSPDIALDGRPGRTRWTIESIALADDGRTVRLHVPSLVPAMQVHLTYRVRGRDGEAAESFAHLTIHATHSESLGGG